MCDIISLNVGGCTFWTYRSTLCQREDFFSGLVKNGETSEYFIDRDPAQFRYILNWLRGNRSLPDDAMSLRELAEEADYYLLKDLFSAISQKRGYNPYKDMNDIAAASLRG